MNLKKKHQTRYENVATSTYSIMYITTPTNDKTGCHITCTCV